MSVIDFKVPLSGSQLFDIHTIVTAKKLCDKFIGLNYSLEDKYIHIYGELNDFWFEQWNKAVFQLGTVELEDL